MLSLYKSSVGKKVVVAVTGMVLYGFLILHMVGNLKAFAGVDPVSGIAKLDLYAQFLREVAHEVVGGHTVLWITRIVLLLALVLHVITIIQLRALNRRARPVSYNNQEFSAATPSARTMFWGGLLIFVFIVVHLGQFTIGNLHFHGFVEGQVYRNIYAIFRQWPLVAMYVVALLVVGSHLYHGVWSLFQTLGLDQPERNSFLRGFAAISAVVIVIGFLSVPVAMLAGWLPPPPPQVP